MDTTTLTLEEVIEALQAIKVQQGDYLPVRTEKGESIFQIKYKAGGNSTTPRVIVCTERYP